MRRHSNTPETPGRSLTANAPAVLGIAGVASFLYGLHKAADAVGRNNYVDGSGEQEAFPTRAVAARLALGAVLITASAALGSRKG